MLALRDRGILAGDPLNLRMMELQSRMRRNESDFLSRPR